MGVAETVGDAVPVTVGLDVGVTETDGLGDGDVGVGVADGEALVAELDGLAGAVLRDGLGELAAGAGVVPWAGPSRLGVCTAWWLGASIRTDRGDDHAEHRDHAAGGRTRGEGAGDPGRYSVRRRSRSQAGRAARCAAQLLNGAAAMPSVGNSSSAGEQRPRSAGSPWSARAAMPGQARAAASDDSAQLARSASHHLARSLVFGVRRNAALLANRPSTEARATTSEVDCQMKNAPSASRQDAPVPRRSSATARTSPSAPAPGRWRPGTR